MLSQTFIEENVQLYLDKMEEKHKENADKINQLQKTLNNAATKIQRCARRYFLKKKMLAAIKIQRAYKKYIKKKEERSLKVAKFRIFFSSYKIFYFLSNLSLKKQTNHKTMGQNRKGVIPQIKKRLSTQIVRSSSKYLVIISAFHSELSYIKKYMAYDWKAFHENWKEYEQKQREWMWSQIRKKWVYGKDGIWINEHHK